MKKFLTLIAIAAVFAACESSASADAPKSDSTAVVVDTTKVDSLKVCADTCKAKCAADSVKK